MSVRQNWRFASVLVLAALVTGGSANAETDAKPVASVNGKVITEAELLLAEAEIGKDLKDMPPLTRKRYLTEFLIENELFSAAAEKDNIAQNPDFALRTAYWRRRVLRDLYFGQRVKASVTDADIRAAYDEKIKTLPAEDEVQARHILVKTEDEAKTIATDLAKGAAFEKLAAEKSLDAGTKDKGGDLGFFGKGKFVPQMELVAFKLAEGQVSPPVESPYGWHLIKTEKRRAKAPPAFDAVKDRIRAALMYQKAEAMAFELRGHTSVDYLDPELKTMVDEQNAKAKADADQKGALLNKIEAAEKREKEGRR